MQCHLRLCMKCGKYMPESTHSISCLICGQAIDTESVVTIDIPPCLHGNSDALTVKLHHEYAAFEPCTPYPQQQLMVAVVATSVKILTRPGQWQTPDDVSLMAAAILDDLILRYFYAPAETRITKLHSVNVKPMASGSWDGDLFHQALVFCCTWHSLWANACNLRKMPSPFRELCDYYQTVGDRQQPAICAAIARHKRADLVTRFLNQATSGNSLSHDQLQEILDNPTETQDSKMRAIKALLAESNRPAQGLTAIAPVPTQL